MMFDDVNLRWIQNYAPNVAHFFSNDSKIIDNKYGMMLSALMQKKRQQFLHKLTCRFHVKIQPVAN